MRAFYRFILALLLCAVVPAARAEMTIYYLDVGQADAAVIQCDGATMMIDGGNSGDSSFIYAFLTKTLGIDRIDIMVATHPHEDHIGGLSAALNACSVGVIYSPVTEADNKPFRSLTKYAAKQGLPLTCPPIGSTIALGSAQVEFIGPLTEYADANDQSIVVRLRYGQCSFLFTGDMELTAEADLLRSGCELSADVLKVGHHGSDTSTSEAFLAAVSPSCAVISVGADNTYGHPCETVLQRLEAASAEVYRTDRMGTITCTSDGSSIRFRTEKKAAPITTEAPTRPPETASSGAAYIGNKNSKRFHYPDCASVSEMKEKNKVALASRDEAIQRGFSPCGRCHP